MQLRNAGFLNRLTFNALAMGVLMSTSVGFSSAAQAGPSVIIDVASGKVLHQDQATRPWYPASLTKLMTAYVALAAVKEGRVTMDTPFIMSPRAARMAPSKMGFNPGTAVTLDNALKMLMVKSANDIAVMIAEGISGSVEDFAAEMNSTAARLGMRESHFVNPNGLPDPAHVSSARDMALIGRALYVDFPDYAGLFDIGALRMTSGQIIPTHNGLLGRYPGADGMKTGFICASGFNVVASATHGNQQLIAVVMGSSSAKSRTIKVATLLDAAFAGKFPTGPSINQLPKSAEATPADIHDQVCGRHRVAQEDDFAVPVVSNPATAGTGEPGGARDFVSQLGKGGVVTLVPTQIVMNGRPAFEPIDVFIGPRPGYTGNVAKARDMPGPMDATAYAAAAKAQASEAPLAPDPSAVSMKLAKGRHAHGSKAARAAVAKAKPEKTKLVKVTPPMAPETGDAESDSKPATKPTPKPSNNPDTGKASGKQVAAKPALAKPAAAKPANHAEANLREKLPKMTPNKINSPKPNPAAKPDASDAE